MIKALGIVFSALMFSVVLSSAQAKVTVSERTKYFSVKGKTGKQIYRQVTKRAPAKLRKNRWIAATYASYDFKKVKIAVRKKRCVATNVNLHLSLVYYFPRWANEKAGSKKLQKQWKLFSRELVRHERTHGEIFLETVKNVERELLKLSGRATKGCLFVSATAKRKIRMITRRGDAKHALFDRRERRSTSRVSKLEKAFVATQ